ncbi:hypothetical protein JCM16358_08580 [Halanaerocella petrolearia]
MVGTALVAFLLVLDVIPRLVRFSQANKKQLRFYQFLILVGPFIATNLQFYNFQLPQLRPLNQLVVIICGLVFGTFVGLVAGALTEVLKVLPVLSRRLNLEREMRLLLLIVILGKTIGSLLYWLIPGLGL